MPLLWISISFVGGVLLGAWLNQPVGLWLGLGAGFCAVALLVPLLRRIPSISHWLASFIRFRFSIPASPAAPLPYAVLLTFVCLGAARFQSLRFALTPQQVAWYNDSQQRLAIEGEIVEPPEPRDSFTLLVVEATRIWPQGLGKEDVTESSEAGSLSVKGRLLAKVPPLNEASESWHYGDRVRLEGRLRTPFETEDFSYLDYLAHRGIHSTFDCSYQFNERCASLLQSGAGNPLRQAIYNLRQRLTAVLFEIFPDPEASLLAGILLGVEGYIPTDVRQAFNDTGTAHIIAISGFNFAIVAGLFAAFFGRLLGRWRGMMAAFLGIALYAVLAGASAGVVRAAIMGGLSVFAAQIGRRQHGLNSLAFVAALMALADPHVLWDVSFQLSFMATLGLILYADPLEGWFYSLASRRFAPDAAQRLSGPVGEYFLFTLAAQLTTLPLILYYFRRLSLASLLANPLILPAQPPVMILGGLAALSGLIWTPLGQAVSFLAWPFVVYTVRVVEWMARLPGGSWAIDRLNQWIVVGFYALLFAWTALGRRLSSWAEARWGDAPPRLAWFSLAGVSLLTVVVWRLALAAPDGKLHLLVLDVGAGDAILVRTPGGRLVLIDGGPSPSALSDALGRRLPLGRRQFDWWIVAAAGEEQVAALPLAVERFPPQRVLWAGPADASYSARQLRQVLARRGIPVVEAQAGHTLDLSQGARLSILRTTPRGAVLLVEWGRFRALLPIGLDFDALEALLTDRSQGAVTALLLAEGGYAPLNPPGWIARWQPGIALLSIAPGDREGRPSPETLRALEGYMLLRTDSNGWIELTTDSEQMWVEVERR
jgi:competence protein ComEC